jgi:hypothetical protein
MLAIVAMPALAAILLARAVGSVYPTPFSKVGSTGIACGKHSPSRIIPQRGQVPENSVNPPNNEHWRVFHPDKGGLHLANDPGHLGPQSRAFTVKPVSVSGA